MMNRIKTFRHFVTENNNTSPWFNIDSQLKKRLSDYFFSAVKLKNKADTWYLRPERLRISSLNFGNGEGQLQFYYDLESFGLILDFNVNKNGPTLRILGFLSSSWRSYQPNPELNIKPPVKFNTLYDLTEEQVARTIKKLSPTLNKYFNDLIQAVKDRASREREWYRGRNPGGPQSGGL